MLKIDATAHIGPEAALVMAVTTAPEFYKDAAEIVSRRMFADQGFAAAFAAIEKLPRDAVTLNRIVSIAVEEDGNEADVRNRLDKAGKIRPGRKGVIAHARTVVDLYTRRRIQKIALKLFMEADTATNLAALAQHCSELLAETVVSAVGREVEAKTLQELWHDLLDDLDKGKPQNEVVNQMGTLRDLVPVWGKGELVIIGGRPGHGKTAFMRRIVCDAVEQHQVLVYSMEESAKSFSGGILGSLAGVDRSNLIMRSCMPYELERLCEAAAPDKWRNCRVVTKTAMDVDHVCGDIRSEHAREPFSLVVVDYLQYMSAYVGRGGTRRDQVNYICKVLKQLARDLQVCVVTGSQLNRASQVGPISNRRPTSSSFLESGQIEADADVLLGIFSWYKEDATEERARGVVEINVLKNRQYSQVGRALFGIDTAMVKDIDAMDSHRVQGYRDMTRSART